jgi:hypothetical protein
MASVFGWLIVLLVGVLFYKSGSVVLPIEETVRDLPEHKKHKR